MTKLEALPGTRLLRAPLAWWEARSADAKDAVLALALALSALVPALSQAGAQLGDLPRRPSDALGIALVLGQSLPLALRRRQPAAGLALIGGAFACHQALGYPTTFVSLGLYLALYSVGAHQHARRRAVPGAASIGYAGLAVVLHGRGSPTRLSGYLTFYLGLVLFWLVGAALRKRRVAEAERRRLVADAAAADERTRIARELHDVVTHHVTATVVQADAAQFLLESAPDRAASSLTAVSGTGRRALAELRHLLDVLEATGESSAADPARADRAPALGRLRDLVEQARRSGQPVELLERGERRPRAEGVDLACYRIVQESITNAMKHSAGCRTRILIRYRADAVEIEVTTDRPTGRRGPDSASVAAAAAAALPSGGRGLTGLRERVRLLDGEFTAGPRPDGGFRVHALIPSQPVQE